MKKTNKIKMEIEITATQKIDLIKALSHIKAQGAMDNGRALQLLAISYMSEHPELFNKNHEKKPL